MKNGDYELVVAPKEYSDKVYRNKYCYKHYLAYWKEYGIIPKNDEIIHHKDGNKHNNSIENLELMNRIEHIKLHNSKRTRKMVLLKCPICEKEFVKEKRNTHLQKGGTATYCSKKCTYKSNKLRSEKNESFLNLINENVIKEFSC